MNVFCGCVRHASLIQTNVCSEIPRAEGTHPQKNRPGVIVCDAGAINAVTAPERERRANARRFNRWTSRQARFP